MRVLVTIFEQLVPISGGGTPRIRSIIRNLVKRGHKVTVAASFRPDLIEATQFLKVDEIFPLKNVSRLDKNKMKKYLLFHPLNISKVVYKAMKLKPDLIIAHNSIAGLASILAKKPTKALTVLDMTDLIFEYLSSYDENAWTRQLQRIGQKVENYVLQGSDKIITVSQAMKMDLIQKGAKNENVNVVYDGVETETFKPRRNEATILRQKHAGGFENIVMHHGVIDPQDNPEILVDAAALVIKEYPNTIFWVIGEGAGIPGIKEKTKRKGLNRHFFFSGWIPFEEIPTFISACDVGLVILPDIPSARIRVTLKGFEYWACEKPIVVPDLPALREVVEPSQTGLFYKPGDPENLAKKICTLLSDKNSSKGMGEDGRRLVEKKYSWDKLAAQFVSICDGMFEV